MKYKVYRVIIIIGIIMLGVSLGIQISNFRKHSTESSSSTASFSSTAPYSEADVVADDDPQEESQETVHVEADLSIESPTYPPSSAEVEAEPEAYYPYGEMPECYFSNTANTIDAGGVIPVSAQGTLVESAQKYLRDQGITAQELRCIDDSVTYDGPRTSFQVQCVDADDIIITITYDRDIHVWQFER